MVVDDEHGPGPARRRRYGKGLPGYHDPISGMGGAAPAYSALTLRLCLAVFGFLAFIALSIWLLVIDVPTAWPVTCLLFAAVGAVDIAIILSRKRRGEPG